MLGFDGWLINIENKVEKHNINNLLEFVRLLTKLMHDTVPGSTVIWYDSVTKYGTLSWQNCLNELNKCFFDLCDGIFTNYTWKEGHPKTSAAIAGETRRYDVYMGIDVFGRNTYGGGGFQSNVGLTAARDAGVSAALFAPGWVYETQQSSSFISAQNRWWGLVAECWPVAQQYPLDLPFFSNFNQGFWKQYFDNGIEVSTIPWSNISCQNLQPLLRLKSGPLQGAIKGEISGECPIYSGGACIKFSGSMDEESHCLIGLYEANAEIDGPFEVTYTVRSNNDSSLLLLLRMRKENSVSYFVLDMNEDGEGNSNPSTSILLMMPQKPIRHSEAWNLCKYRVENPGKLEGVLAVCYSKKQTISNFIKKFDSVKLSRSLEEGEHSEELCTFSYEAFLGHIAISADHEHNFDNEEVFEKPLQVSDVMWEEVSGERVVSLKLAWRHKASTSSEIMNYNIFVCKGTTSPSNYKHLGVAMVGAFYVSQLEVPKGCQALTFFLQTFCKCGYSGTLDTSCTKRIEIP
ncbi:hypothetical protein L7F22_067461 [Adiantum nelumboides]|nr:hypothetical protein [Adiantum nelumboides]